MRIKDPLVAAGMAAFVFGELAEYPDDPDDLKIAAILTIGDVYPNLAADDVRGFLAVGDAVAAMARHWPSLGDETSAAVAAEDEIATPADRKVERTSAGLDEVPFWFKIVVLDALAGWATRNVETCGHGAADLDGTAPVYSAAWRPGLVVCQRCTDLLSAPMRACQGCGADDEFGHLDGIWMAFGRLIVFTLCCPDCAFIDDPDR